MVFKEAYCSCRVYSIPALRLTPKKGNSCCRRIFSSSPSSPAWSGVKIGLHSSHIFDENWSKLTNLYLNQSDRIGGGGRSKFLKMVELLGPQIRKLVELLGVKFAQNGLFLKVFAAPSAPRPILNYRTILCIKFDHMRQLFSNFWHFRKNFTKMRKVFEIWTLKHPKNHFLLHFSPTAFEK